MIVNGYKITGNHAASGREYRICDAAGNVIDRVYDKRHVAERVAAAMPLGDVPEPVPEPTAAEPPEPAAKPTPKRAAKKTAKKAAKRSRGK